MANPQLEHGHLELANEIVESLAGIRISGTEWQVLWVVLRKTYGWHKKLDAIPLSQFHAMTGLSKPHVIRSLKKLLHKNVITVVRDGNGPPAYGFNKDFEKWEPAPTKTFRRRGTEKWTERARDRGRVSEDCGIAGEDVEKRTYGRYVRLTTREYGRLVERFGAGAVEDVIEFFDLKIESKGALQWRRDHESDYATILYWERNGWIRPGRNTSSMGPGVSPPISPSSCAIMGWAERERQRESRKRETERQ